MWLLPEGGKECKFLGEENLSGRDLDDVWTTSGRDLDVPQRARYIIKRARYIIR